MKIKSSIWPPIFSLSHGKSEYKFILGLLLLTLDFTVQQLPPFPLSQEQSLLAKCTQGLWRARLSSSQFQCYWYRQIFPAAAAAAAAGTDTTAVCGHWCYCSYRCASLPCPNVIRFICHLNIFMALYVTSSRLQILMSLILMIGWPLLLYWCPKHHTCWESMYPSLLASSLGGRLCHPWRLKRWRVLRHEREGVRQIHDKLGDAMYILRMESMENE